MTNYLTDLTFCENSMGFYANSMSFGEKSWFFSIGTPNDESVVLVGQKYVIYYIQVVVVALLSVDLVESVDLVSVDLVVNCISLLSKNNGGPANKYSLGS